MKKRVRGRNRLKGRKRKPSTALRARSSGEVKRCRLRFWLISTVRGVLDFFVVFGARDQVAGQNRARALQHRAQALRLDGRDGGRLRRALLRGLAQYRFDRPGFEQVGLVEDREARNLIKLQLAEDSFDRLELLLPARVGRVHQMYEQVRVADLFERGAEGREQVRRQVAYEADRVVDDDLLLARQAQAARGRVERGEHALLGVDRARSEGVQQRGLAGVRVADNRDDGELAADALLAPLLTAQAQTLNLFFESVYAVAHAAAVGFELRLAGAAP